MTKRYFYQIAGLTLEIKVPKGIDIISLLPSFSSFSMAENEASTGDCVIELVNQRSASRIGSEKLLSDVSEVWGDRFRFFETNMGYRTVIQRDDNQDLCVMDSRKDFSRSSIYFSDSEPISMSVLSWLTMMVFGQACLPHNVILVHASAVRVNGRAYAFLGKSGTGKSTHSRLWLENISGTELLNDDNPAVRLEEDGKIWLYGTPWSGKTSCYKNIKVQLGAFIRLKQATYNRFLPLTGLEAFISVMPSCTAIRWNKMLFQEMNNTLEEMIRQVHVATLECLPNREAVQYC